MCIIAVSMELWEKVFAGCGKASGFSVCRERCFPSVEWLVMHISIVQSLYSFLAFRWSPIITTKPSPPIT